MLHSRLLLHRLVVDGTEVPVSLATLVVVDREGADRSDWEIVANTTGTWPPELGRNHLEMTAISGADDNGVPELSELSGQAIVARHVEHVVVWRGDGELDGFEDRWLS